MSELYQEGIRKGDSFSVFLSPSPTLPQNLQKPDMPKMTIVFLILYQTSSKLKRSALYANHNTQLLIISTH